MDPDHASNRRPLTRRHVEPASLPLHEELDVLARHYLHVHNELETKNLESSTRRRLEERLLETRERFDRLLDEWVQDPDLREEWREYLHNRVPEPSEPPAIEPLVFQGVSPTSGSILQLRGSGDDLEAWIDGALFTRVAAEKDLAGEGPVLFRLDGRQFDEMFGASAEAFQALADFRDGGDRAQPPWEHASELLADGLIDVHFDLTPRGRRALSGR